MTAARPLPCPLPPDGLALFRTVVRRPAQGLPKLVLADWLDENDMPDLAAAFRYCGEQGLHPHKFAAGTWIWLLPLDGHPPGGDPLWVLLWPTKFPTAWDAIAALVPYLDELAARTHKPGE